jgi:glycine oxidase
LEGFIGMQHEKHDIIKPTARHIDKSTYDVIIIGGGIIGCGIALALTESGYKVAIVERHVLGSEASTAAIGGLTPQSDEFTKGPLRQFALQSVIEYPLWLKHLFDLTDIHVEYHNDGQLEVAFTDQEVQTLNEHVRIWRSEQFEVYPLSTADILSMEPYVNPEVLAGCHLPGEPIIDPVGLMDAVATALNHLHCTIIDGTTVIEVTRSNGRATGVKLSDGRTLSSEWVVLSAGAWSSHIRGVPPCPVHPVKGQALLAKMWPQRFRYHIHASPGYIVPRVDGRVVLGVTYEFAGYDKRVTVAGLHQILNSTMRLSRAVGDCEVIKHWAGLRPRTPDQKPILGLSSKLERLVFATGHFGLGITLAPITARLIADLIINASFPEELKAYSPDRFLHANRKTSRE